MALEVALHAELTNGFVLSGHGSHDRAFTDQMQCSNRVRVRMHTATALYWCGLVLALGSLCATRGVDGGENDCLTAPPAVFEVLQLARSKRWSECAARIEALDLEALQGHPRNAALCAVAVNTMARLHRPAAAHRCLVLLSPRVGDAPPAAIGALLKAYCLVDDLRRARELVLRKLRSGPTCRGWRRFLSTYLRYCLRTGRVSQAGEVIETFGASWMGDETCRVLLVRLLCQCLHVCEAWKLAHISVPGERGGDREGHRRLAQASMYVCLSKTSSFVGNPSLTAESASLARLLLSREVVPGTLRFLKTKEAELAAILEDIQEGQSQDTEGRSTNKPSSCLQGTIHASREECLYWYSRLLVLPSDDSHDGLASKVIVLRLA